jgi:hypothetical protein
MSRYERVAALLGTVRSGAAMVGAAEQMYPDPVVREQKLIEALHQMASAEFKAEPEYLRDRARAENEAEVEARRAKHEVFRAAVALLEAEPVAEVAPEPKPEPVAEVVKKEPSPAQVAARERQALGSKGARKARMSRIKATQAKAIAKAKAENTEPHFQEGGFHSMPNLFMELLPSMPGPVVKAYVVACRLALEDGTFEVGHTKVAELIAGSPHREVGERAMRRLVDAGLLQQRWRGGPGRVNGYRLASLARLDIETAKAVLALPLTASGAEVTRLRRAHEQEHATSACP